MKIQRLKDGRLRDAGTGRVLKDAPVPKLTKDVVKKIIRKHGQDLLPGSLFNIDYNALNRMGFDKDLVFEWEKKDYVEKQMVKWGWAVYKGRYVLTSDGYKNI